MIRIKITLLCFLWIAISRLMAAGPTELKTNVRNRVTFTKDWRFFQDDNPRFREPGFDDSKWRTLNLPHDWSIEGDYQPGKDMGFRTGFFPEGIGWYRKHFNIDKSKANKQFVIQFDGVYMNSEVWVNGEFCGRRPYGYATFQYDITSKIKFGQDNVVAVRVDNSNPASSRWYAGSGIYRNVYLIETNFVHFRGMDGVYVTTPVAERERAVVKTNYIITASFFSDEEIKIFKKNKWLRKEDRWENEPRGHQCIIRSILYDADGLEVARKEKQCEIFNYNKAFNISLDVEVDDPHRWSDTSPYLYTLRSEIEWNGKILDDEITPIGIRKLEFNAEKGMLVNDERKVLKGVCLHHDAGAVGVAVPNRVLYYRLRKLKDIGCNAIRTSHNPFSPEFYAMCDSMGFYVMDELLDEWTSAWGYNFTDHSTSKAGNGFAHYFNQWYETEVSDAIHRDRNHPCVVMWSVGNELPELRSEPGKAQDICRSLVKICHREDITRPVTFGNNGPKTGYIEELDILGFNYVMANHDFEVRGSDIYEADHRKFPDKVMVGTETSRNEIDYFLAYRDNPYVIGQFIWTGIQYLGEVKAPKSGLRGWLASLLDMSCNLLPEGAQYAACWRDDPQLFITSSDMPFDSSERGFEIIPETGERVNFNSADYFTWNWESKGAKYVTVYSNCQEVELILNGKSLGRQMTDFTKYATKWTVDYKRGTLQAIGYNNGKKVMQRELYSTAEPAGIEAKPYFASMNEDPEGINIIEVSIVDRNGRKVPEATNDVKVEVMGSARLLAIDTGNLFYKGNFKTDHRQAANGYMTVTIQATEGNDPIVIKLSSKRLKPTVVEL